MPNKQFAERLNKELDSIGLPTNSQERINALARLIKIPKFKAEAFLNGSYVPDAPTLQMLAEELEVSADWLIGKDKAKH
ncbi:MAG: hypothetical protein LCH30_02505 [Proteobacteria bacterium]|nr:hypothetical protein [Pseudomonadota bacterium]